MDDSNKKSEELVRDIEELVSYREQGHREGREAGHGASLVEDFECDLREIFEHTAVGMYRTTSDGRILMANPALVRMLGFSTFEELAQRNLEENGFEPDYRRKQFKERIEREGKIVGLESVWTTRQGNRLVVIENARAVRDQGGNTLYYEGTTEDITARKEAAEALRESEERLRAMFEMSPYSTVYCDLEGNILACNKQFVKLHGCKDDSEAQVGRNFFEFFPEEERELVFSVRRNTIEERRPAGPIEHVMLREDGTRFVAEAHCTLILDCNGEPKAMLAQAQDITVRMQAAEVLRESEKRFRALAEKSPNMIFINVGGRVIYANEECEKVMGYRKEDFYAGDFDFLALIAPEDRGLVREKFAQHTAGQEIGTYEYSLITKSGDRIEAIIATKLIEHRGERAILGIVTDITGRKRTEEELQKAHEELEERVRDRTTQLTSTNEQLEREVAERKLAEKRVAVFKKFAQASEQGMGMADLEGNITYANATLGRLLGFENPEDVCGTNVSEYYLKGDLPIIVNEVMPGVISGSPQMLEIPLLAKDGTVTACIQSVFVVREEEGKPLYLANVITDITERKKAEDELRKHRDHLEEMVYERTRELEKSNKELEQEIAERKQAESALQESETRYRTLSEAAFEGIAITEEGVLVDANEAFADIYHCSLDELKGREIIELVAPDDRGLIREKMRSGCEDAYEHRGIRKDGSIIDLEVHGRIVVRGGRKMRLTAIRDVTERKRGEEALRKSEEKYRVLVESAGQPIFTVRREGIFEFMNNASASALGGKPEDFIGKTMWDLFPPEVADLQMGVISKAIDSGRFSTSESESMVQGRKRWYFARIQPLREADGTFSRALVILADTTDRKEAEDEARRHRSELAHVWRVNTMGEMASGLAHELNQPLCAILNYANFCLRIMKTRTDITEEITESIEQVASQADRAGQIIKRIRSLIAKRKPQTSAVDINHIVKEVVELERAEADNMEITVRTKLGKRLPHVLADSVEIEEVILNLVRNAFDAMTDPTVGRREVAITTRKRKGNMVEVCVKDTGKGFASLGQQIFDSFFTTKPDGLGIGLSISRTIVELHGGKLWAEENSDCGASFKFTLPTKRG